MFLLVEFPGIFVLLFLEEFISPFWINDYVGIVVYPNIINLLFWFLLALMAGKLVKVQNGHK